MARLSIVAARLLVIPVLILALGGLAARSAMADIGAFTFNRTALITGEGANAGAVVCGTVVSSDAVVRISVALIQSDGAPGQGGTAGVVQVGSITLAGNSVPRPWVLVTAPAAANMPGRSLLPGQTQIAIVVESFDAAGNRVDHRQGSGVIWLIRDVRTAATTPTRGQLARWVEAEMRGPERRA